MSGFPSRVPLGRTGLSTSPIGLGSSFGIGAADVERAFDRGINYFYWGSLRRRGFGQGIRRLATRHRDDMVIVVQSYTRVASLMGLSLERALRKLGLDHTDLLLLGWWNDLPPDRILDAALRLRESGKARHIMISCHHRPSFAKYIAHPAFGAIMVRYNAAHPGAEREVFPLLPRDRDRRPGVVSYTATRWGALVNPRLIPDGERCPTGADCYRFALSNPDVDVCLAGPKNAAELDGALDALERGPLDPDEMAWMRRVGQAVHDGPLPRTPNLPIQILDRITGAEKRAR